MNRRLLALVLTGAALAATACGSSPTPTSASEATTARPPETGEVGQVPDDLDALQDKADHVLEDLFRADGDLDYAAIEDLTTRAVAARYRNQELLASVNGLDPVLTAPKSESVTVTSAIEVVQPEKGVVTTTGSVTVTHTDADGVEDTGTYTDVVFEVDGDDLLVADWRRDNKTLAASSSFLDTSGLEPSTVGDITVTLEPGYRDPDGDPAFVEYLFSVTNGSDLIVVVDSVELIAPDNESYDIQFGTGGKAEPGDTATARVGFEGSSVPVSGGTMMISLKDEDRNLALAIVELPAFLDEDGEPEAAREIALDDVEFSASGTRPVPDAAATSSSSDTEVLQAITDAEAFRDSLLGIAQTENDPSSSTDDWGIPDAWLAAVPGLELVGSQIRATPTKVSGLGIVTSKSSAVEVLPFAVMDASGSCAGGAIVGQGGAPAAFRVIDLERGATCNAAAVMAAIEAR